MLPERDAPDMGQPCVVGLMSGERAPFETALAWCGWAVRVYEILPNTFNGAADLLDPAVRSEAESDIELADLVIFQMDCKTLSRAREIPLRFPAKRIKSLPLRGAGEHHRGLPRLQQQGAETELKATQDANSLIDWGTEELHKTVDRAAGALLENPRNSLLWEFPRVAALTDKGCEDYDHDACAHGGARAKKQRWRGNIPEVGERRADCHHMHSSDEWQPERLSNGEVKLVANEEKEYTAHHVFYMAVQVSIWAVRTGRAKLRLPRLRILPVETGSRLLWHKLPAAALREWAMPGFGLRLQLRPPTLPTLQYAGLPMISSITDKYPTTATPLPEGALYVGSGHALHKLPRSTWAPPYQEGVDGESDYCVALYQKSTSEDQVLQQSIQALALREPWVTELVVDTPPGHPSHAEVLAWWMWRARADQGLPTNQTPAPRVIPPRRSAPTQQGLPPVPTRQGPPPPSRPTGGSGVRPKPTAQKSRPPVRPTMKLAGIAMLPTVRSMCAGGIATEWRWRDVEVHRAIRKMFPAHYLDKFPLPPLEDLVNDERLAAWRIWAHDEGVQQASIQSQVRATGWASLAVGQQRGAAGSKHAVEPVVGFGLGKEAHFQAALSVGVAGGDPFAIDAKAAPDMRFAAQQVAAHMGVSRQTRQELQGLVKELSSRTKPLSDRLRSMQLPHVRMVAGKLCLGFVVIVALLTLWYDAKMPGRFVQGYQGTGKLEESRLWNLTNEPDPAPESDVFEAYRRNKAELMRQPLDEEAQFLWDSCIKEGVKRVGLKPVSENVLEAKFGKGQYSATPCFVHAQACGKKRLVGSRGWRLRSWRDSWTWSQAGRICRMRSERSQSSRPTSTGTS